MPPLAVYFLVLADAVPVPHLDGPMKVKVLAALAGLIILGFGMVALTWLGGRFTRRYMQSPYLRRDYPAPGRKPHPDDWAEKPLNPEESKRDP